MGSREWGVGSREEGGKSPSPPKQAREPVSVSPEQKQHGVGPVKADVSTKSEGPPSFAPHSPLPTPHSPS